MISPGNNAGSWTETLDRPDAGEEWLIDQYMDQYFAVEPLDKLNNQYGSTATEKHVDRDVYLHREEEWEEVEEYEGNLENWPRWLMNLLSGPGDLQDFFSRWADHE